VRYAVTRYAVTINGEKRVVELQEHDGQVTVTIDGARKVLEVRSPGPGRYGWVEGTRVVSAEVEKAGDKLAVTLRDETVLVELADARLFELPALAPAGPRNLGPSTVRAPMAGRVVKVLARAGDAVKSGQGILVIEAMKMENEVRCPRDGRVREVRVAEGAAVDGGEELAVID
jgi:biotin carboxyl carrier protein